MSVSSVLRMAITKSGLSVGEVAQRLGTSPAALSMKFTRNVWAASDLIRVAREAGAEVALLFPDGTKLVLNVDDTNTTKAEKQKAGKPVRASDQADSPSDPPPDIPGE